MKQDDSLTRRGRRRWHQFSVRALLVFVLLVSVLMSWIAVEVRQARARREAAEAIVELGGHVFYDQTPPGFLQASVKSLIGLDLAVRVNTAYAPNDAAMEKVKVLTSLKELAVLGEVTDAGMAHVASLKNLEILDLSSSRRVSDGGLEHLAGLPKLRTLHLEYTPTTDAGLAHLAALTNLDTLLLA